MCVYILAHILEDVSLLKVVNFTCIAYLLVVNYAKRSTPNSNVNLYI